jgi:hypothetical protein
MRRSTSVGCAALAALVALASLASTAAAQTRRFHITSDRHVDLFLQGLRTPGAIVLVNNSVKLDLSRKSHIPIAEGVTLVGGRDARVAGPLLYTKTRPKTGTKAFFEIKGDHVRIVGVRIRGPDTGDPSRLPSNIRRRSLDAFGIYSQSHSDIEVAHSEIYGWEGAAVRLEDRGNAIPRIETRIVRGAPTVVGGGPMVRIHDNFIHHNQQNGRQGYGVVLGDGAYALIERNVFDYNRHAIAGNGSDGSGYVALDNLVLKHGGKHRWAPIGLLVSLLGGGLHNLVPPGVWLKTHQFDMHGQKICGFGSWWNKSLKDCGRAGYDMHVAYNSFLYAGRHSIRYRFLGRAPAIKLRGTPERAEGKRNKRCGATVFSNVFEHSKLGGAVKQSKNEKGLCKARNRVKGGRLRRVLRCDIDGDGVRDKLLATGQGWWWASKGARPWAFLRRSMRRPTRCPAPGALLPPPPPPRTDPPPPPPPGAPDLVISNMTADQFTVTNQGGAAAGPFWVSVATVSGRHDFDFAGLGVGESQTRSYIRPCGEPREARADSLNQVAESNETNNTATHPGPSIC